MKRRSLLFLSLVLSLNLGVRAQDAVDTGFLSDEAAKLFTNPQCFAISWDNLFGRSRVFANINSRNATVRGYAERNAINDPIQGSAADIIKVAMNNIYKRFRDEGIRSKMILQVHDELNFSVYPEEKDRVKSIVIAAMQSAIQLSVPLIADSGWGTNWLEAH